MLGGNYENQQREVVELQHFKTGHGLSDCSVSRDASAGWILTRNVWVRNASCRRRADLARHCNIESQPFESGNQCHDHIGRRCAEWRVPGLDTGPRWERRVGQ